MIVAFQGDEVDFVEHFSVAPAARRSSTTPTSR